MQLSDFLMREAIITDLLATTREDAIREIVRSVQDASRLVEVDTETLTGAFLEREQLCSTAIGLGVALPHGGHHAVDRVFGTIALSPQAFNSTRQTVSRSTSWSFYSTLLTSLKVSGQRLATSTMLLRVSCRMSGMSVSSTACVSAGHEARSST